ncbi:hypothetical protein RvY_12045 [Ramazzottius varieornatus]|uniref:BAG family molecular chaperone regulator 1 n=1 Tax=Ramazzottius varieornatus TaxID=947166 RepID=A0A1D1VK66_RAMVA|nr:hypothetical protein RvY_12045 [Ramazzottius varieornatus]
MSALGKSLEGFVAKAADKVEGFADSVIDLFHGDDGMNREDGTMGSTTSKSSTKPPRLPVIPHFSVAYGLNNSGKTVLYHIDVAKDLPSKEETQLTVLDLQNHLASLTNVPPENQTLIHRGAHLTGNAVLVDLKIREGSKMMMLGRKPPDPDEAHKKSLSGIEDEVSAVSMQAMEIEMVIVGGNASESESVTAKSLEKQLKLLNEHFMKLIMKTDAVELPPDRVEVRAVRKGLVGRIHQEMERIDLLLKKLEAYEENADRQIVLRDSR